jgi:predicted transcriptional regulator of viral defense system
MSEPTAREEALAIFAEHGGVLRTKEALELGVHPRTLYALRDAGELERLSRGLYRLADLPPLAHPDLVVVARSYPDAVICLISALDFHDLTTQIPHVVDVAIERGATRPSLDYPPLRVFHFSGEAWSEGVEVHELDGAEVRVYGPAKSVADAFKYRHKLGLDLALEALELYRKRPDFDVGELLRHARICRVEKVMRPYLEALLHVSGS